MTDVVTPHSIQLGVERLVMPQSVREMIEFRRALAGVAVKIENVCGRWVSEKKATMVRPGYTRKKSAPRRQDVLFSDGGYRWMPSKSKKDLRKKLSKTPVKPVLTSYFAQKNTDRIAFVLPDLLTLWDVYSLGSVRTLPKLLSRTHRILLSHIKWRLHTDHRSSRWKILQATMRFLGKWFKCQVSAKEEEEESSFSSDISQSFLSSSSDSTIASDIHVHSIKTDSLGEASSLGRYVTNSLSQTTDDIDVVSHMESREETPVYIKTELEKIVSNGIRSDNALSDLIHEALKEEDGIDERYQNILTRAVASLKQAEQNRVKLEKHNFIDELQQKLDTLHEEYRDITSCEVPGVPDTPTLLSKSESRSEFPQSGRTESASRSSTLSHSHSATVSVESTREIKSDLEREAEEIAAIDDRSLASSRTPSSLSLLPSVSTSIDRSYSASSEATRPPTTPEHVAKPFIPPLNTQNLEELPDDGFLGPLNQYVIRENSGSSSGYRTENSTHPSSEKLRRARRQTKKKFHRKIRAGWRLAGLVPLNEHTNDVKDFLRDEGSEEVRWKVHLFSSEDESKQEKPSKIRKPTSAHKAQAKESDEAKETREGLLRGNVIRNDEWSAIAEAVGVGEGRYRDSVIAASSTKGSVAESPLNTTLLERRNSERPVPLGGDAVSPAFSLVTPSSTGASNALKQVSDCFARGLLGKEEYLKVKAGLSALERQQQQVQPKISASPLNNEIELRSVQSNFTDTSTLAEVPDMEGRGWDETKSTESSANSMRMGSPRMNVGYDSLPEIPDSDILPPPPSEQQSESSLNPTASVDAAIVGSFALASLTLLDVDTDVPTTCQAVAAAVAICTTATGDSHFDVDAHEVEMTRRNFLEEQRGILAELQQVYNSTYEAKDNEKLEEGSAIQPFHPVDPYGAVDDKILMLMNDSDNTNLTECSGTPLSRNTDSFDSDFSSHGPKYRRVLDDSDNSLIEWSRSMCRRDRLWCVNMPTRTQLQHMTGSTTTSDTDSLGSDSELDR